MIWQSIDTEPPLAPLRHRMNAVTRIDQGLDDKHNGQLSWARCSRSHRRGQDRAVQSRPFVTSPNRSTRPQSPSQSSHKLGTKRENDLRCTRPQKQDQAPKKWGRDYGGELFGREAQLPTPRRRSSRHSNAIHTHPGSQWQIPKHERLLQYVPGQ